MQFGKLLHQFINQQLHVNVTYAVISQVEINLKLRFPTNFGVFNTILTRFYLVSS